MFFSADAFVRINLIIPEPRVKQSGLNAAWGVGERALNREPVHSLWARVQRKPQERQPHQRQRADSRGEGRPLKCPSPRLVHL